MESLSEGQLLGELRQEAEAQGVGQWGTLARALHLRVTSVYRNSGKEVEKRVERGKSKCIHSRKFY